MNIEKLKIAEAHFLQSYPDGFADPELAERVKKHRMDRMHELARQVFARQEFTKPHTFCENLTKLVSRASMVSMFEKPKFRDFIKDLNSDDRERLTEGYRKLIHGNQQKGFNAVVELLAERKIAKWSLMTIGLVYYRPEKEVFVKPTTAKKIVEKLELNLTYRPQPTWEFYRGFREAILEMRQHLNPSVAPNNAALTGFLMIVL